MRENRFWKLIKPHLPGDVSRVENVVEDGMPDVSGVYMGVDYWVELKVCNNKKKIRAVEKLLRHTQIVWHFRRGTYCAENIFVAVRYPFAIMIYRYSTILKYNLEYTIEKKGNSFMWEKFEDWFIGKLISLRRV